MLRTRVIPVVLINGYSVLKSIKFQERRNQGNPIAVARVYNTRNVDELILLDIEASKENRSIDLYTVEEIASECFMPLAMGGGIRSLEDIRNVLDRGADKVIINTAALENPQLIVEAVYHFGAQCIVGAVDFKKEGDEYFVYSRGKVLQKDPFEWVKELVNLGAGEIFINSVDLDGTMSECDLFMIEKVVKSVNVPVIYCGGVSSPESYLKPIQMGVSSVAAASIFHFTRWTPDCVKKYLKSFDVPVRI